MAATPAPLIRHVSREDLALNRYVWLATGGVYLLFVITTVCLIMFVSGLSPLRMQVMGALLLITAAAHLRNEPPAIGTIGNHAVLTSAWVTVGVAFWAYQPAGGIALGGMMFVGPLIAVRLRDRWQIAGHMTAANLLAAAVALFAGLDPASQLAVLLMTLASTILCSSCVVVLEASEAQGDELERLVRRDPLTGIGNRRLLDERLDLELARHERNGRQLTVVALDLNGFKVVNDERGHEAGDELLRDVAAALMRVTDNRDVLVRQGGDKFCLVLMETTPVQAARTTNAIRAELAKLSVSSGFGIASSPDDAVHARVLLHVADERLRESKAPFARSAPEEPLAMAPAHTALGRMFT